MALETCCALLAGGVLLAPSLRALIGKLAKLQRQKVRTATKEPGENIVDAKLFKCSTSDAILGELMNFCGKEMQHIPAIRMAVKSDIIALSHKILADEDLHEEEIDDMRYLLDVIIAETER